jgi:hypothetical protein
MSWLGSIGTGAVGHQGDKQLWKESDVATTWCSSYQSIGTPPPTHFTDEKTRLREAE